MAIFAPVAAVLLFSAIPIEVRRRPPSTVALWHGAGAFRAGAAKVPIELPERPVLAGYAGHRRAKEAKGRVHVRALALEAGRGERLVITAIDTLLIPPRFGRREGCELLAATHTHTGPGGLWDSALAGWLGAGEPDRAQEEAVERARSAAVAQAVDALEPAELQVAREQWADGPARARSEGRIDPELVAVRLRRAGGGRTIATVVVYAMHPTSAPHESLSADWPAELETDSPVLVMQGAVGNATWPRQGPPGRAIAGEVDRLLEAAPAHREGSFECTVTRPELPQAQASVRVPWLLRRAVSNALSLALPASVLQTRVRLGPIEFLGVPGEPVGELGVEAKPTVLVGLAGGYLGYVETGDHWRRGAGESGKTYFGPDLARALGISAR